MGHISEFVASLGERNRERQRQEETETVKTNNYKGLGFPYYKKKKKRNFTTDGLLRSDGYQHFRLCLSVCVNQRAALVSGASARRVLREHRHGAVSLSLWPSLCPASSHAVGTGGL